MIYKQGVNSRNLFNYYGSFVTDGMKMTCLHFADNLELILVRTEGGEAFEDLFLQAYEETCGEGSQPSYREIAAFYILLHEVWAFSFLLDSDIVPAFAANMVRQSIDEMMQEEVDETEEDASEK